MIRFKIKLPKKQFSKQQIETEINLRREYSNNNNNNNTLLRHRSFTYLVCKKRPVWDEIALTLSEPGEWRKVLVLALPLYQKFIWKFNHFMRQVIVSETWWCQANRILTSLFSRFCQPKLTYKFSYFFISRTCKQLFIIAIDFRSFLENR